MKERTVKRFSVCIASAIFVCLMAYTVAATFGYLTFGSNVPSDILQAYDASQPHVLIAIVALAAKSCATYPILAFCGRLVYGMWRGTKKCILFNIYIYMCVGKLL